MMMRAAVHAAHIGLFCALLPVLLSASSRPAGAAEPDEHGLWQLWQQHAQPPHDHKALLAACEAFSDKHPADPFLAISHTLAGWHLLQLGRIGEAARTFERVTLSRGDHLRDAARSIALAWLTRMDREKIKQALQFYYRKEMAYPVKLPDLAAYPGLPESLAFPEHDRWNASWSYHLTGFKTIPGLLDQKYALRSLRLGEGSDLGEALAVPCGGLMRIEPLRIEATAPGRQVLELRYLPEREEAAEKTPTRDRIIVKAGSRSDAILLAYVGSHLVVLSDHHHWKVLPKPGTK